MCARESTTSTFGLLQRIRAGDEIASSRLFARYRRRLSVLIHYKLGPELRRYAEVDDVLQEVFLRAFQQIDGFEYRNPGSFMAWLLRIADHVVADLARYQGRQKRGPGRLERLRSLGSPQGADPADSRTPSRILAQREHVEALLRTLDALPADYREVILLARFAQVPTQEIARRMGRSREAVAVLLHRALLKLKQMESLRKPS